MKMLGVKYFFNWRPKKWNIWKILLNSQKRRPSKMHNQKGRRKKIKKMSKKVSTSTLSLVMKMRTKRKSSTQTKCFSWKTKSKSKKTKKNWWKTLNHLKTKNNHKFRKLNLKTVKKIPVKRLKSHSRKIKMKKSKKMRKTKMMKRITKKWRKNLRKKIRKSLKSLLMKRFWILNWANFTSWLETFTPKTSLSSLSRCALHTMR